MSKKIILASIIFTGSVFYLFSALPAEADVFNYITPVNATPITANSWQDVDVSAYVPSGATGVILHVDVDNGYTGGLGLRKNGSTDTGRGGLYANGNNQHFWTMAGLDANRIFEAYIGTNTELIRIWLTGYTMSGVTFFDNAYEKTPAATGVWT